MKAGWHGDDYRIDIRIRDDLFGLRHGDRAIESLRKPLRCIGGRIGDSRELRIVQSAGNALAVN